MKRGRRAAAAAAAETMVRSSSSSSSSSSRRRRGTDQEGGGGEPARVPAHVPFRERAAARGRDVDAEEMRLWACSHSMRQRVASASRACPNRRDGRRRVRFSSVVVVVVKWGPCSISRPTPPPVLLSSGGCSSSLPSTKQPPPCSAEACHGGRTRLTPMLHLIASNPFFRLDGTVEHGLLLQPPAGCSLICCCCCCCWRTATTPLQPCSVPSKWTAGNLQRR